jgi:cyclophilin family peptidyl-prolyl cis-trans isomerase
MSFRSPSATRLVALLLLVLASLGLGTGSARADNGPTRVRIDTNLGSFTILLETTRAPLSTQNFIEYVRSGHYDGTVFHRVINGFVIQGGGFDEKGVQKPTRPNVANESGNGLSNRRGTVGLARAEPAHSGNAQFYVNLTDNDSLDPTPLRWGYAVFGHVVEGMDVVDKIGGVATGAVGTFAKDAPLDAVVIRHAAIIGDTAAPAAPATPTPPPGDAATH